MQEMGDLQEQACWVILYVAAVSVGTSESIVKRGAVDSIIASMRSCDRHAGVQAQGWCVHTQDVIGIRTYAQEACNTHTPIRGWPSSPCTCDFHSLQAQDKGLVFRIEHSNACA